MSLLSLAAYMAETAECLISGFAQAFMKRGLPRALVGDNGVEMVSEETCRKGWTPFGNVHETMLPYFPVRLRP